MADNIDLGVVERVFSRIADYVAYDHKAHKRHDIQAIASIVKSLETNAQRGRPLDVGLLETLRELDTMTEAEVREFLQEADLDDPLVELLVSRDVRFPDMRKPPMLAKHIIDDNVVRRMRNPSQSEGAFSVPPNNNYKRQRISCKICNEEAKLYDSDKKAPLCSVTCQNKLY